MDALTAELADLDATLAALHAAIALRAAERRLDAPREPWRRRLMHRRAVSARGGRIASALAVLRRLDGYERIKVAPGRWEVMAETEAGRMTVATLTAPPLNRANPSPVVRLVESYPLPPDIAAALSERAQRGAFAFIPRA